MGCIPIPDSAGDFGAKRSGCATLAGFLSGMLQVTDQGPLAVISALVTDNVTSPTGVFPFGIYNRPWYWIVPLFICCPIDP